MKPDLANLITKEAALDKLFQSWMPEYRTEIIPLWDGAGRVLAEDQFAGYDLPVMRASTMDGIAVRSERFVTGIPDTSDWQLGRDYVRADTGDDFDDRFDAVIAIENVTFLESGGILLAKDTNAARGANVKPRGADMKQGSLLVKQGTVLTPMDLAAIAMGGANQIPVVARPRVGFLPTGSELVPAGSELGRGQNFDSNSYLAAAMLKEMGAQPVLHPIVRDDPEALYAAFQKLLIQCDMVLINAGTSKGGEDYCAALLEQSGGLLFHGVAAVPGRPMSMAVVEGKPVVNLSGPTFAAFYSMDWAVRSILCRMLNIPVTKRPTVEVTLATPLQLPPIFSMMTALRLEKQEDGSNLAFPIALRGSKSAGIAAVLTADAVYVSTIGEKPHAVGEKLKVSLIR